MCIASLKDTQHEASRDTERSASAYQRGVRHDHYQRLGPRRFALSPVHACVTYSRGMETRTPACDLAGLRNHNRLPPRPPGGAQLRCADSWSRVRHGIERRRQTRTRSLQVHSSIMWMRNSLSPAAASTRAQICDQLFAKLTWGRSHMATPVVPRSLPSLPAPRPLTTAVPNGRSGRGSSRNLETQTTSWRSIMFFAFQRAEADSPTDSSTPRSRISRGICRQHTPTCWQER